MKARIKLENGKEPVTSGKEKQKQVGGSNKENQPRKEKKDHNKEKQQKAKEREEKKKKRVQEKNPRLQQDGPPLVLLFLAIIKKLKSLLMVKSMPVLLLYSHHHLFVAEILLQKKMYM